MNGLLFSWACHGTCYCNNRITESYSNIIEEYEGISVFLIVFFVFVIVKTEGVESYSNISEEYEEVFVIISMLFLS